MNRGMKWSFAIYMVLYLVIFALAGVLNLAVAQWDLGIFYEPTYWISTIFDATLYISAFQVSVFLGSDLQKTSNEQYKEVSKDVFNATQRVDDTFTDFVADDNLDTKKSVWKAKKNNEYIELNNKMPHKVLLNSKQPQDKWTWRTRRWMRRLNKLKEQTSNEWIDKNVMYVKVDYPKYVPQEILSGSAKHESKKRLLTGGMYRKAFAKRIIMISGTILVSAIFNSVFFTGSPFSVAALLLILTQFFFILVNIAGGIKHGVNAFEEITMNNLYTRREKLLKYFKQYKNKEKTEVVADEGDNTDTNTN